MPRPTVGVDNCPALEKRGPRRGGGFTNLIHASICRKDGAGKIATVLAAIQEQQGDPNGYR